MLLRTLICFGLAVVITAGNAENKLLTSQSANRTVRSLPCQPTEYSHNELCCINCPAGTHVSTHCTVNHGRGHCSPCTPGKDFTAGPNGLEYCLPCHPCRVDDQIQVAGCTATGDYQCECKPGTFSTNSFSLYCDDCSRCPEGQRVKNECTPTSDTVCEDIGSVHTTAKQEPDDPQTLDRNSHDLAVALSVSISIIVVVCILLIIILWKKKQRDKEKLAGDRNENYQRTPFEDPLEAVRTEPQMPQPVLEQVDNLGDPDTYTPLGQQDNEDFIPVGKGNQCGVSEPSCEEEASCDTATLDPTERQEPNLETCTCACGRIKFGRDEVLTEEEWLECYNCLKENVLPTRWKEMMRLLGLREVDIESILISHNNDCGEARYQMFLLWRNQNGQSACMSKVFVVLDKMNLRGCKENIANGLICKRIHVA